MNNPTTHPNPNLIDLQFFTENSDSRLQLSVNLMKDIINIFIVYYPCLRLYDVCCQCVCECKSIHRTRRSLPASDLNERLLTSYLHTSFFILSSLTSLADQLMPVSDVCSHLLSLSQSILIFIVA